jgi:hypothetical protein
VTAGEDEVDYGKLIDEERGRTGSAAAAAEAQRKRELDLIAFFRSVEIDLGREMAKANEELKKRGIPVIAGPFRPVREEEKIEFTFGSRRPCCRLLLQGIDIGAGLAGVEAEILDSGGTMISRTHYFIGGDSSAMHAYRPLVEGVPDHGAEVTSSQIAQEIVSGILRGRFA